MGAKSKVVSDLYDMESKLERMISGKARGVGHLVDGDAEEMSDQELLDVMAKLGIVCSKADLDRVVAACTGTQEVFRSLCEASGVSVTDYDEDDVMYCLIELCRRWYPDWVSTDNLDDLMQEGYDCLEKHRPEDLLPALALWERAWEMAKALKRIWGVRYVDEFDDYYFWGMQSLHNWVQDYETELLNVTFFNLGDERMHDDFVRDFAKEFPADVMSVLGFMVDDDGTLVKTIIDEEGDWPIDESWDSDYASELGWTSSVDPDPYSVPTFAPELKREPIRVQKVGRNEPCPCGSGKKYKKCCGRYA